MVRLFVLIELLGVVGVAAILASILLTALNGISETAGIIRLRSPKLLNPDGRRYFNDSKDNQRPAGWFSLSMMFSNICP